MREADMGIDSTRARQKLWEDPEDFSVTDHQQSLTSQLSPERDIRIYGEIGSGKTFAVRHFLKSNDIPFSYFTASELFRIAQSDEGIDTSEVEESSVVIIDNFDVIPKSRNILDRIHEQVELELDTFDRSIWWIFPQNYQHDWFESVLAKTIKAEISLNGMTQLTIDHLESNLRTLSGAKQVDLDNSNVVDRYGYHTVFTEFISAQNH